MGLEMADKYKIVIQDGKTKVFNKSGEEIRDVCAIEINHSAGNPAIAKITLLAICPEVIAELEGCDGR